MNELISEPKVSRQIPESMFELIPRAIKLFLRLEVVPTLNDSPGCSLRRVLAVSLIKVPSSLVELPFVAKQIHATTSCRELKAIRLIRLNVL